MAARVALTVLVLAVALCLPGVLARDCSREAADIAHRFGDFVEACLPGQVAATADFEVSLEVMLDRENVASVALFGTVESGLDEVAGLLVKSVDAAGLGTLAHAIEMKDVGRAENGVARMQKELRRALAPLPGMRDCSRALIELEDMQSLRSLPVVSQLLGPLDRDRSALSIGDNNEMLSTKKSLFVLKFDMDQAPGNPDWTAEGWDWRAYVDTIWGADGTQYTPGTLPGRLSDGLVLSKLSTEEVAKWKKAAQDPVCLLPGEEPSDGHHHPTQGNAWAVVFLVLLCVVAWIAWSKSQRFNEVAAHKRRQAAQRRSEDGSDSGENAQDPGYDSDSQKKRRGRNTRGVTKRNVAQKQ